MTISTWIMPRLRSLYFREFPVIAISLLLDFFTLLRSYGPHLQYLTLECTYLRREDISTLLALCSGPRSFDTDSQYPLFIPFVSGARLERIRVRSMLVLESPSASVMKVAVKALRSFKIDARTSFPKLIEAEFIAVIPTGLVYRDMTASIRRADAFITFRYRGNTYRLLDGATRFVGAFL
jgi:hypothetical protein